MKGDVLLIAFSGLKGSGKDTAAAVLIEEFGFTKVALADPVRDFAYAINPIVKIELDLWVDINEQYEEIRLQKLVDEYGWDEIKRTIPEVRRLMQAVGTEGGRKLFGENFWIDRLAAKHNDWDSQESRYVITDCRFLNEAQWARDQNGFVYWVERSGLEGDGHASETTEVRDVADMIIENNTTQAEFEDEVRYWTKHTVRNYWASM